MLALKCHGVSVDTEVTDVGRFRVFCRIKWSVTQGSDCVSAVSTVISGDWDSADVAAQQVLAMLRGELSNG